MAGTKAASHQEQQQHEERENSHSTGRKGRNQLWWIRDPIGRGRNPLEWWGTTHLFGAGRAHLIDRAEPT